MFEKIKFYIDTLDSILYYGLTVLMLLFLGILFLVWLKDLVKEFLEKTFSSIKYGSNISNWYYSQRLRFRMPLEKIYQDLQSINKLYKADISLYELLQYVDAIVSSGTELEEDYDISDYNAFMDSISKKPGKISYSYMLSIYELYNYGIELDDIYVWEVKLFYSLKDFMPQDV